MADKFRWTSGLQLKELIPLETTATNGRIDTNKSRLVIGHNVAFDRSFVKEQYYLEVSFINYSKVTL